METALDRADEVLAEGRDRVVKLPACFDEAGDLAKSLALAGDEIANGSEVKVSVRRKARRKRWILWLWTKPTVSGGRQ